MKMVFRWYGEDDPVTLKYIKQVPCISGIVSALYNVQVGENWPLSKIEELKRRVESKGLGFEVIESVPVHEDIKLGLPTRDTYIENYKETIRNLSKMGIKVICYNFMPVFDWTRSQLDKVLDDESTTLVYYKEQIKDMNPLDGSLSLPGWDSSYKLDELQDLFEKYSHITEEKLWENLEYFLKQIVPVAEQNDIKMAIHPDDPPWPIFGLPRIITGEKALERLVKIYDSPSNGLTICTGSLGASKDNNVVKIIEKFTPLGKVHFVHARNVKLLEDGSFEESAHLSNCGSMDMTEILKALYEGGFTGYIRPDHGRMIWGETGKAGYGLYDRALGAMYLTGIWEAIKKQK
ncbi:mannonate dehydratase [Clostridium paridis]|uniref:Mannonate dehydratase n=1 Tax=Clostridium paridis TaxID=2803863 RepID=A0A937FGX9_9CLOT|nr:mannonate dehydratase [Clostridium paridis]MBL4933740.1 mannonate dehydratase [Clostridium paridis]